MQPGLSGSKAASSRRKGELHRRNAARWQQNVQVRAFYAVHVGNGSAEKSGSWAALVIQGRRSLGYTQEKLAALVGVDRTTVWRWEKQGRVPDTVELTLVVARTLGADADVALHAAGHVGPDTPEPEVDERLAGLDARDPVVRHILELDVDEEMRGYMLDRRRQQVAEQRERDLREIEQIGR